MTPKEKAYELFEKFLPILGGIEKKDWVYFHGEEAKQCALIAVDEIINQFDVHPSVQTHFKYDKLIYWQEVKQEIEKI
jgi:hypothetical protein